MSFTPVDIECARLCAEIYQPEATEAWDAFDAGADDGVCWALRHYTDHDKVVFRGSDNFPDWIRDLLALANPFVHHGLGPVHPGFYLGLDHAVGEIAALLKKPPVISGHSLGGGRAAIAAGLMLELGVEPTRIVTFGQPKPGFKQLSDILSGIPQVSVRNGGALHHDYVTDVPFSFPPEEYVHPSPLTVVSVEPGQNDWGPFAYHHMPLYYSGVSAP